MKRASLWAVLGAVALLAATVGYRLTAPDKNTGAATTPPSNAFYALVLSDVAGQAQRIDQWRGKVLVANYWATWCHPCREEMPGFSRLHGKYQAKGVQFVGISIDDAAKIAEFQKHTPVDYPLLIAGMSTMQASAELGNTRQALPFTAVFDREGRLAMTKLGRWAEADLERELVELLSR